jgi:hypothetical protein
MTKPVERLPDEKPLPHVLTALIAKRSELAGLIENLQGQVKQAAVHLDNVEATIRLFAPDIDLTPYNPRPVPPIHHAFRGETSRIVLETIRNAAGPLSTNQMTETIMKARGLDLNDLRMRRVMQQRVGACLRHWEKDRGVIRSAKGPGQVLLWELVR